MAVVEGAAEASDSEVLADVALALIENNKLLRQLLCIAYVALSLLTVGFVLAVFGVWILVHQYGSPWH